MSTITFEATPKIAEKIAVSQTLGSLSLSLRSIADNQSQLEEQIANGDVKVPENGDAKAEKAMIDQAAAAPTEGGTSFATGADVSRFQRRSVPARATSPGAPGGASALSGQGVAAAVSTGPVVRVARGNNVTVVPVGAR